MPGVAQSGNSRISAIVTGNVEKGARLADFHGVDRVLNYSEYDAFLAGDAADAVYIALPNSLHADYAIRAARAGKHVMVEKPLAATVADAEAMIAAAKEGGVFLMTAYRLHNEPGTLAVLEYIRGGAIGQPRFFHSIFSCQVNPDNHRLKAEHWGGPLQDIGVYCLNTARHIFAEEPIEVSAMINQPADDERFGEVEASIAVTLRFSSGGLAQFIASFGAGEMDGYRVVGEYGDLELSPGYRFETATKLRLRRGGEAREIAFPQIDHFGAQTAYFSDCIMAGMPPEADGEEGLADVRALLAIEKAARTGRPQPIASAPRSRHPTADMVRMTSVTARRLVL